MSSNEADGALAQTSSVTGAGCGAAFLRISGLTRAPRLGGAAGPVGPADIGATFDFFAKGCRSSSAVGSCCSRLSGRRPGFPAALLLASGWSQAAAARPASAVMEDTSCMLVLLVWA